jgi:lipopolysaccharide/colanic/teichoic acid biosynthesis glycosyltransferase
MAEQDGDAIHRYAGAEELARKRVAKAFNVAFSGVVLFIASPLMLLIAIAIKFSSAGPIFFAQERVGLKRQIFKVYKFRTMGMAAREESGTRWTVRDDPR